MAFESFDNVNQFELQVAIEAELNLFENGHTYTNMETFSFQPNFSQQQEYQPNLPQQQEFETASPQRTSPSRQEIPTSSLQQHSIEKKKRNRHSAEFKAKILADLQTSTQADLARRYKIYRRLIGKWSKP